MLAERPRARRHVFSAHLELLDVESESKIITRTRDLTMFGFRAEIKNCSWPVGTRVRAYQNFTKYQFSKLNSKKAANHSQRVAGQHRQARNVCIPNSQHARRTLALTRYPLR